MFSLDRWQEVLQTLARAKLRSALTAFAVAWGIFMLVALLGFGHGLRKGTETQFADDAANSVWIFGGQTSQPYQGMPVGRRIVFTNADYDNLRKLAGIERLTGRFFPGGGRPFAATARSGSAPRPRASTSARSTPTTSTSRRPWCAAAGSSTTPT
jgi:putative ABC transport system permease protein